MDLQDCHRLTRLTLSLFGFGFFDWTLLGAGLAAADGRRLSHGDGFYGSSHGGGHGGGRRPLKWVVGAELSPFGPQHRHHL